ncbi:RNA polymerase primary sigma factor [Ruminococcaceae bacterium YRB3002]|nr:RNA polymerase primary sigma factor [Ruminococcaceae bacterium YRB3002]
MGQDRIDLLYKNTSLLTHEDEVRLAEAIAQGDINAREQMIAANEKLVIFVASQYRGCGLDLEDLRQEGFIGLMSAVNKFDPSKGFRFSTYAVLWIKQAITRYIARNGRSVSLPTRVHDKAAKLIAVRTDMMQKLGVEPTTDELCQACGLSAEDAVLYMGALMEPVSLSRQVGDDLELGDTFAGDITGPVEQAESGLMAGILREAVDEVLTHREAVIIRYRYGLIDDHCYSLREVSDIVGLTKERVRQLEKEALAKLKSYSGLLP